MACIMNLLLSGLYILFYTGGLLIGGGERKEGGFYLPLLLWSQLAHLTNFLQLLQPAGAPVALHLQTIITILIIFHKETLLFSYKD